MAGVRRGEREWRTSLFHTSTFTRNLVCSRNGLQYVITDSFHPLNAQIRLYTYYNPPLRSPHLRFAPVLSSNTHIDANAANLLLHLPWTPPFFPALETRASRGLVMAWPMATLPYAAGSTPPASTPRSRRTHLFNHCTPFFGGREGQRCVVKQTM